MLSDERLLADLREHIATRVGWGPAEQWTNTDFHTLGERIATATGTTLSASTLKRVWGRVNYASQPSTTTLDALCRFAGYDNWRAYRTEMGNPEAAGRPLGKRRYWWITAIVGVTILLALLLAWVFAPASPPVSVRPPVELDPTDYRLSLRPVTIGVPNSVVFDYDAALALTEEVYLQQSWDPARREKLARDGHTHTSIYYLPGYYRAKLIVGNRVVQERELLLRSEGWVAAVEGDPVPVYLPLTEVRREGRLSITEAQLSALGIRLQPEPPTTILTHVGGLQALRSDDFTFRTRLRHDYGGGAAACRHVRVTLLLKNSAIIVPLSAPGCVADLYLFAGGKTLSGRDTDLSAFGVAGDDWLELVCRGMGDRITISINGHEVLRVKSEEEAREIVGIRYEFTGTGSVDGLRFGNRAGEVWAEEF